MEGTKVRENGRKLCQERDQINPCGNRNADQFDTVRGGEVSLRGRVRRKKRR